MSGHSKWATIKRKKGATDAARGRLFTRLIKEIAIAARSGGDPDGNPRLRLAIQSAKSANMPADNIKRAIQRGTGELEGVHYEEVTYESYGPGGVAIMIDIVTDNKNRTVSELRHLLSRNGGNLAESGSVSWKFNRHGVIVLPKKYNEDDLLMLIIDAGADDLKTEEDHFEVITPVTSLYAVKKVLEENKMEVQTASIQLVPMNTIKVVGKEAEQVLRLMEVLEEHDDVQNVYADFDIDPNIMEAVH